MSSTAFSVRMAFPYVQRFHHEVAADHLALMTGSHGCLKLVLLVMHTGGSHGLCYGGIACFLGPASGGTEYLL